MLKDKEVKQHQIEMVILDDLIPKNHLLRKIEKTIDFSFIREHTKDLYCSNNGRPAVDPEVLFKILFIGYLYGIRSERQIIRDIEVNVAYRWFLGFSLTDKIPNASTISQNRRRRFCGTTISQDIFDNIVIQAINAKLVDGKTLYTDSTHMKANANKNKFTEEMLEKSTKAYMSELEQSIDIDRISHEKKPLKSKKKVLSLS